ncbi:hypothetical protein FQA47_016060 [Oryzias melastigma]|uniref:Uncharacterized protein n=1 Tax=Oryzias melastigma TaxID=30732 RepID=A0A834FN75_ORYME|nr:hypothetical protein FQA47_016060 [Oryzias melastigma]
MPPKMSAETMEVRPAPTQKPLVLEEKLHLPPGGCLCTQRNVFPQCRADARTNSKGVILLRLFKRPYLSERLKEREVKLCNGSRRQQYFLPNGSSSPASSHQESGGRFH